jgi:hypothetical protein
VVRSEDVKQSRHFIALHEGAGNLIALKRKGYFGQRPHRGGSVRSHHVASVSVKNLGPILNEQLYAATDVMSDDGGSRRQDVC